MCTRHYLINFKHNELYPSVECPLDEILFVLSCHGDETLCILDHPIKSVILMSVPYIYIYIYFYGMCRLHIIKGNFSCLLHIFHLVDLDCTEVSWEKKGLRPRQFM